MVWFSQAVIFFSLQSANIGYMMATLVYMHVKRCVAAESELCVGTEGLTHVCRLCKQGPGSFRPDGYQPV